METAVELTDQEREIMRRRDSDQSWDQIGRAMGIPTKSAILAFARVSKKIEKKRRINAGYIDPKPSQPGELVKMIIEHINNTPGSTSSEIAHAIRKDSMAVSQRLWELGKNKKIRRTKQDGRYRHYPSNWLTPQTAIANPNTVELPGRWATILSPDQLKYVKMRNEGKTIPQIAAEVGVPAGTVNSNLGRARHRLARHGIADILITPQAEKVRAAGPKGITEEVQKYIEDNPGTTNAEIAKAHPETSPSSVNSALLRLVDKGGRIQRQYHEGRLHYYPKNYRPAVVPAKEPKSATPPPAESRQMAGRSVYGLLFGLRDTQFARFYQLH